MRRRLLWPVASIAMITVVALYQADSVRATPASSGFKGTTLAAGTFAEFQVFNHNSNDSLLAGFDGDAWWSLQKTKGPSDMYFQSNVWQPVNPITGAIASTGWHTHPGHSLIIITAGAVAEYDMDCTRRVYGPGTALGTTLVDPGEGHVHIIRNEGTVVATGIAVQLVAKDAPRRIDAAAPNNCQSIR